MTKQTISIGNTPNDRKGDSLRAAFQKVNANFTELYDRAVNTDSQTLSLNGNSLSISNGNSVTLDISPTGDLTGSVFADDSTILVDGVAGKIRGDIESGVVNIDATTGDVNITSITDDVNITAADNIQLTATDNVNIYAQDNVIVESNGQTSIRTDVANANHNFIFRALGDIEFPDGGRLRIGTAPATSVGQAGDVSGTVAFDNDYIYYSVADYDTVTDIWKRVALTGGTW